MKSTLLVLALVVSANSFAGDLFATTKLLDLETSKFKISDAKFGHIATKTETRQIPGCDVTADRHPVDCQETVVLEREAVVAVNVSYVDPSYVDDYHTARWVSFNFRPEEISAADLAALKATSRNPFSKVGERVAKKNFSLEVKRVQKDIKVIDYDQSTICTVMDNGQVEYGCVQNIVYKPGKKWFKQVSVLKK